MPSSKIRKSMLTQARVKELLRYEPETGALYYRVTPKARNPMLRVGNMHSGLRGGYRSTKIEGYRTYPTSWIVWLYHKGTLPKEEIDHINMQRWDDRIENLREASRSQNCMNRKKKIGKWGYRGVKRNHKKFSASLVKDQVPYYLGSFATAEEAAHAYDKAAKELFGEFALLNFSNAPVRDWLYVAS